MKTITINEIPVTLTPYTTEAREGRLAFKYNRLDLQQFPTTDDTTDTDKARAIFENLTTVATPAVVIGWLQASLDRAFQAAQKEAGKDTLTDDVKLQSAVDYMVVAKFGLSKSVSMSPSQRILKTYETVEKALKVKLKDKSITLPAFMKELQAAQLVMMTNLGALPSEPVAAPM